MIIRQILEAIINIIPKFAADWPETLSSIVHWCYFMNHYIPVDTAVQCFLLMIPMFIVSSIVNIVLELF